MFVACGDDRSQHSGGGGEGGDTSDARHDPDLGSPADSEVELEDARADDTPATDAAPGDDLADATGDATPSDAAGADAGSTDATPSDVEGTDASRDATPSDVEGTDGPRDAAAPDGDDADSVTAPALRCADIDPSSYDDPEARDLDAEAIPLREDLFDIGIQSGAVRAESVLLWTHVADGFAKRLLVWRRGESETAAWVVYDEDVTPGPAGYTHVSVEGLAPCTWYSYGFFSEDEAGVLIGRSPLGRFKTPPPPGVLEPVRIGATSCTSRSTAPWEALTLTAEQDIELLLHLGDQSYNDSAETLSEYRSSWRATLNDPGYRALHAAVSHLSTWDDHEVTNNWDPETISPTRRANATQAYFETLAVERGPDDRLWHSYSWGETLEIFVTDCRSERRPSTRESDEAQYISNEQMAWLQDGLLDSDAHFKVVFSSVPITNMPGLWDFAAEDRWEGYASQRSELLDFIYANELENVWFLGGDFHVGFVANVEPEGPGRAFWEVAVGPGGNGPNPAALFLSAPQFDFKTDGFGTEFMTTLEFDPIRDAVRVVFTRADGSGLYDEWRSWDE